MQRLALTAIFLVACGRENKTTDDGRQTAGAPTGAPAVSSPAASVAQSPAPICVPTGMWAPCSVFERLDRAGLAPRRDTAVAEEAPLTITGAVLKVGTGELELFFYPDVASRERDQGKLEKTKYVRFDVPVSMKVIPTLIHNANLIAILHSRNDHLRERVADAITAGPPQPPRKP